MSESDFTPNKPFVLRVEISAEQASTLVPLFEGRPVLPAMPLTPAPISEEAVDARVLELKERETDLQQREAEFEADVMFREDRIERWRTELEELAALREEAESLAEALAARKAIERAKGLLMEKEGLSEQDAFARLRKASQISGRPLKVVADALIATLSENDASSKRPRGRTDAEENNRPVD